MAQTSSGNPSAAFRQFDDAWRTWIGENLLLGATPQSITGTLLQNGFKPQDVGKEINLAMQSPFLRSAERLINRNRKSEWLFQTYHKLHAMARGGKEIERREKLPVEEFFEQYYFQNKPVIITGMTEGWPAFARWSLDYFRQKVGRQKVNVQYDRASNPNYEPESPRHVRSVSFTDYLDQIEQKSPTNDFYMTAQNTAANKEALKELWKDLGRLPYLTDGKEEGMFWIGPAGTITPLHHDLTNNFMVQFMGRKQVNLLPPYEVIHLYNHIHVHSQVNMDAVDEAAFPLFREAINIECILHPQEVLFIPIGWWHFVKALDVSVTMTHTNFIRDNDFFSFYNANGKL